MGRKPTKKKSSGYKRITVNISNKVFERFQKSAQEIGIPQHVFNTMAFVSGGNTLLQSMKVGLGLNPAQLQSLQVDGAKLLKAAGIPPDEIGEAAVSDVKSSLKPEDLPKEE